MNPKFRAWMKDIEAMAEVYSINFLSRKVNLVISGVGWIKHFSDIILMQSTGLVDKNGVEIFEGDVLYYPDQDDDQYGIVKFDKSRLACVLDTGYEMLIYGDEWGPGEVIGNIHEHPDLVEVAHD